MMPPVGPGRPRVWRTRPALIGVGGAAILLTAWYGLVHGSSVEGATMEAAAAAVAVTTVGHELLQGRPITWLHGTLALAAVLD